MPSGEELAAFEVVVLQMLEDVQERLVYRAQVGIIPLSFAFHCYLTIILRARVFYEQIVNEAQPS